MLDHSTVQELATLSHSVIKLPSRPRDSGLLPHAKGATVSTTAPRRRESQTPASTVSAAKKVAYYCKEHSEEEISYYCFSCWTNICPECAIHGTCPAS